MGDGPETGLRNQLINDRKSNEFERCGCKKARYNSYSERFVQLIGRSLSQANR